MFVPYSSEYYPEHRPLMAYAAFPVVVLLSFWAMEEYGLDLRNFYFLNLIEISGIFFLLYVVLSLPVLWTFSVAVCSRIGNFVYLIFLALVAGLFWLCMILFDHISYYDLFGIFEAQFHNADGFWLLSFVIHALLGMQLVFYPFNEVYCFIYVPPFRTFALSSFWIILLGVLADSFFCVLFGWTGAIVLHPLMLLFGAAMAGLLAAIRVVRVYPDEKTIWRIFQKEELGERYWDQSWSARRRVIEEKSSRQEELDRQAVREAACGAEVKTPAAAKPASVADGGTAVLCSCGQVVRVGREGARCPGCGSNIKNQK